MDNKTELRPILHVNFVKDFTESGKEIYCRKKHKLCVPTMDDCLNCSMFRGTGQGEAIECEWEDTIPYKGDVKLINWYDRKQEMLRVSKLIDDKILKK